MAVENRTEQFQIQIEPKTKAAQKPQAAKFPEYLGKVHKPTEMIQLQTQVPEVLDKTGDTIDLSGVREKDKIRTTIYFRGGKQAEIEADGSGKLTKGEEVIFEFGGIVAGQPLNDKYPMPVVTVDETTHMKVYRLNESGMNKTPSYLDAKDYVKKIVVGPATRPQGK